MTTQDQPVGISVTCSQCSQSSRRLFSDPSPQCPSCGSALPVLEPTIVQCGWCNTNNQRHLLDDCDSCGGPLPPLPGPDPGPRPAAAPRAMPDGYVLRKRLTKNPQSAIGLGFVLMSLLTVPVPFVFLLFIPLFLAGAALLYTGLRKANQWLRALQQGTVTRGVITAVEQDRTQSIDNQHPWQLRFSFELHAGGAQEGSVDAWDPIHAKRAEGDRVWVVYDATDPASHALWPPVH